MSPDSLSAALKENKVLCKLCGEDKPKLAKSHIFSVGFFGNIESKGRLETIKLNGEKGRRFQNAIYDPEIVCLECEHDILEKLDDYAITIFRDKKGANVISIDDTSAKLYVYKDIDKTKIRAFIASLLWRISVSTQLELFECSIGHIFEERIRSDLRNNGKFDYIDANVFFFAHPMHCAFMLPQKNRIQPKDKSRDPQAVNGWDIQLPNISMRVSLDKRENPNRFYFFLTPEITGDANGEKVSSSLHPDLLDYTFMAVEFEKNEQSLSAMINAIHKSTHNNRVHRSKKSPNDPSLNGGSKNGYNLSSKMGRS